MKEIKKQNPEKTVTKLSSEEKKAIAKGLRSIKDGKTFTDANVKASIKNKYTNLF